MRRAALAVCQIQTHSCIHIKTIHTSSRPASKSRPECNFCFPNSITRVSYAEIMNIDQVMFKIRSSCKGRRAALNCPQHTLQAIVFLVTIVVRDRNPSLQLLLIQSQNIVQDPRGLIVLRPLCRYPQQCHDVLLQSCDHIVGKRTAARELGPEFGGLSLSQSRDDACDHSGIDLAYVGSERRERFPAAGVDDLKGQVSDYVLEGVRQVGVARLVFGFGDV